MAEPLVTVVLSSYDRPTLIRDAIDSVLKQNWPEIQLLIADDWSDQPVMKVLEEYTDRIHKRTRHSMIVQPPDKPSPQERQYGQRCAECINAAMAYAEGEFVCFLPDDDMLFPRSIAVRAQYLIDNPLVNVVVGRLEACKPVNCMSVGLHFPNVSIGQELLYLNGPNQACIHDRNGFWSEKPLGAIENLVDHSMPMVRRCPKGLTLPPWPTRPWPVMREAIEDARSWGLDMHDCPDSNWFMALRVAGFGPFHFIDEMVTMKRYTRYGHRTGPTRRE